VGNRAKAPLKSARALQPLYRLIERHVLAAERMHGDDITVPGQGPDGHRPYLGLCPRRPAVCWPGAAPRSTTPTAGTSCPASSGLHRHPAGGWAHARRQFFELADIAANARRDKNAAAISPIALEAVKRIDALSDIERGINGQSAVDRLRVRKAQSASLLTAMEAWLREQRARLSNSSSVAKPIDYMLRRWDRFTRFIDNGRICLTNYAAERAPRGFALGRKSRLFAGSERGADRAAIVATLIMTAKLNDVDP
jgi:transposase